MGKRVLFITESYDKNPSPNGNCIKIIADELIERGNSISVLTLKNQVAKQNSIINHVNVTRVNTYGEWRIIFANHVPKIIKRCGSKVIKLLKYIFIPLHPFRSPGVLISLYKAGCKIIENNKIDVVVGVYRDFETAYAGALLKKKYPHVKLCIYTLDAISGGVCSNPLISQKKHIRKCHKWETYFLKKCDKFCIMKTHASIFEAEKFLPYSDKIVKLDIPNLCIPKLDKSSISNTTPDILKFVFTGMLSETNADCTFFIKVFEEISKKIEVRFDIYGGISEKLLVLLKDSGMYNKEIFFHGRVSQKELSSIRNEADIFLNFGNIHPCGIPCKIFEYIPMRKIIVSFYKIENDASYAYLSRYPKAILLEEKSGREMEYADKIIEFWKEKKNMDIPLEMIMKEFYENTPSAFIDVIENM